MYKSATRSSLRSSGQAARVPSRNPVACYIKKELRITDCPDFKDYTE
jgi:hypothetical protein